MSKRKIFGSLLVLAAIELLAVYIWSFLFMMEGVPRNHNSHSLQVAALVCIVVFLLAPFGWVVWFVTSSD